MKHETLASRLALFLVLFWCTGCGHPSASVPPSESILEFMSVTWGANLRFEQDFLKSFGDRNHVQTQYVPNSRLKVYQQLLGHHSGAPDLLEVDIVWPAILADDLVDLTPYLKEKIYQYPRLLLDSYTVGGRLVALPVYVDLGVLFYRPELLQKYGFTGPPETWEELEVMATRIQEGERSGGNPGFWGYVWQGAISEGGTCNALEWQSSAGGGNLIEASGRLNVQNKALIGMLKRATGWIGRISPPAEYVYQEEDSLNLWNAGQTVFMRNWASGYGQLANPGQRHFKVAPLPAGPGGHKGTLGGLGIAVSKYAAHRDLAIQALLELTNQRNDQERMEKTEGLPTHSFLFDQPSVKARSALLAVSGEIMKTAVPRPALVTGDKYAAVSHEYAAAVNSVLRKKATAEAAMADLERQLDGIMAKKASSQN